MSRKIREISNPPRSASNAPSASTEAKKRRRLWVVARGTMSMISVGHIPVAPAQLYAHGAGHRTGPASGSMRWYRIVSSMPTTVFMTAIAGPFLASPTAHGKCSSVTVEVCLCQNTTRNTKRNAKTEHKIRHRTHRKMQRERRDGSRRGHAANHRN